MTRGLGGGRSTEASTKNPLDQGNIVSGGGIRGINIDRRQCIRLWPGARGLTVIHGEHKKSVSLKEEDYLAKSSGNLNAEKDEDS